MKCNYCNAIVTKSRTCPVCGRKLQSTNKGLMIALVIIVVASIIVGTTLYDPDNSEKTDKIKEMSNYTLVEKMAMIDKNRFTPVLYQDLLNAIQKECPNYSKQRIADMVAASFTDMRDNHNIKDTYYETLIGIKEAVAEGACTDLKLEQIIAMYAVIRIDSK